MRRALPLPVALITSLLAGCSDSASGRSPAAAPPPVPVVVGNVVEKTVPIQVTAVGNAQAYTSVGIKSQVVQQPQCFSVGQEALAIDGGRRLRGRRRHYTYLQLGQ